MMPPWQASGYGFSWQRLNRLAVITRYGDDGPYEAQVGTRRSPAFAAWEMARAWAAWEVRARMES